jgi:hypothetical protein
MLPNFPFIICFKNLDTKYVGNFTLAINLSSLGITHGLKGIVVSPLLVGWGLNHRSSQTLKSCKSALTFLLSFSPRIVYNIFIVKKNFAMHHIKCVLYLKVLTSTQCVINTYVDYPYPRFRATCYNNSN